MNKINDLKDLMIIANSIRHDIIQMVATAQSGHPGGPLGLADIFSCLYFNIMNHDPKRPDWEDRDRLILSNGHVCAVRYAAMARAGYFPIEELLTFRQLGTRLQGHPSTIHFPALEMSSGSLGQGLSNATGLALAAKMDKKKYTIYVCMSDGECQEGMSWEAAMSAAHWGLSNLVAFVDRNFIQIDGETEDIMALEPLGKKFESFGWHVIEADGHCYESIINSFHRAKAEKEKPTVIIFRTIIGRGVSFMEDTNVYHGKPPSPELAEKALRELDDWKEVIEKEQPSKIIR